MLSAPLGTVNSGARAPAGLRHFESFGGVDETGSRPPPSTEMKDSKLAAVSRTRRPVHGIAHSEEMAKDWGVLLPIGNLHHAVAGALTRRS